MAPPGTPTTGTGLQPPQHTAAPTAVTLNLKEAGPPQPTQATLEERFKHPEATVHVVCGGGKSPRQELIVPKATALQLAEPKRPPPPLLTPGPGFDQSNKRIIEENKEKERQGVNLFEELPKAPKDEQDEDKKSGASTPKRSRSPTPSSGRGRYSPPRSDCSTPGKGADTPIDPLETDESDIEIPVGYTEYMKKFFGVQYLSKFTPWREFVKYEDQDFDGHNMQILWTTIRNALPDFDKLD